MEKLDIQMIKELASKIATLEIDVAFFKTRMEQAISVSEELANRLKKYENEDGVPHGDTTEKDAKRSAKQG